VSNLLIDKELHQMKYGIVVILLSLTMPAFSRDAVFSEFAMGMSAEAVTARYPNLRLETGDAWISLGNAVFTRCYIDVQEGLYRVESAMREEDQDFITALEDTIAQKHGGPRRWEAGSAWSVDRGNRFDDPDTRSIEIYQRNGFLMVVKEFKNAPGVYGQLEVREWERYYYLGEQGPAGGLVFYDKGHYLDGWRYLEAAPPETEVQAPWGWDRDGPFTNDEIERIPGGLGDGPHSAEIIVKKLTDAGKSGCAAQICAALEYGGYDDWYLPTRSECYLMLEELRKYAPAGISKNGYWTSSLPLRHDPFNLLFAYYISWDGEGFGTGVGVSANKGEELSVRAVRKF
jgi:hypothetical protein